MADKKDSNWSPRESGVTEDNKVVTFRTGNEGKEGETLIGGDVQSSKEFGKAHDHYGPDTSKTNDYGNLDNAPDAEDVKTKV